MDDSVASEERTLQHIEGVAEVVCANTSPAGAEVVVEEAEELRLAWQRLRQRLCEAGMDLRVSLDSQNEYVTRCHRLAEDIGQLQALLHRLGRELEEREEGDRTEEQMVGQWRKYMVGFPLFLFFFLLALIFSLFLSPSLFIEITS